MKKIVLIFLFFLISCGYQPVYLNKNIGSFEFSKIILSGNNDINRKIIDTLSIKESKNNFNKLNIFSSYDVKIASKDATGQASTFKTTILVKLSIENTNDKSKGEKIFLKEFTYNNKEKKIELVEYQNSIKNDLINKIISEIIIYLNS